MAITGRLLRSLGLDEEQAQTILGEYKATEEALGSARKEAQDLAAAQQELEKTRQQMSEMRKTLDEEHEAFLGFKAQVEENERNAQKSALFRQALARAGIIGRHVEAVMRASDIARFAVKDGAFEDEQAVDDYIRQEWGDFIPDCRTVGLDVQTPPDFSEGGMTRAQIMGIRDAGERQRAIAKHIDRFQG